MLPVAARRATAVARVRSAGPRSGMAVDVFDDDGHPVRGEVGELVCTKPWPGMTRGLWRDPERYLETYWSRYPGVWWHGDFASVSEDGQWFLHGRSDDTIKLAGKRLGPAEVETAVVAHPAVVEAAAVGIPDDLKGEALWVFVVRRARSHARRRAARRAHRARVVDELGPSFRPAAVRFTTALPKTRSAKVLRRAIRVGRHRRSHRATCRGSKTWPPSTRSRRRSDRARAGRCAGVAAAVDARRLGGVARGAGALPGVARAMGAASRAGQRRSGDSIARRSVPGAARGIGSATSTPRTGSDCSSPTGASRVR